MSETEARVVVLGQMAAILDGETFQNGTSVVQRRSFRETADTVRESIEKMTGIPISIPTLVAFWMGAHIYKQTTSNAGIAGLIRSAMGPQPEDTAFDSLFAITVAYLARDLLAGERVG